MKVGFVNIFGKPNAGKSTLLNALLGEKLAIVSSKVQTTRHRIKGILNSPQHQIVISDTPGIIEPRYKLHERMMQAVKSALEDADVALLMVDVNDNKEENDQLFASLQLSVPSIVVINKADTVKPEYVQAAEAFFRNKPYASSVIAIAALQGAHLQELLSLIESYLPEGEPFFDADQLTDLPTRFFVGELIREKIYALYSEEIPYHTTVMVNTFQEKDTLVKISADIIVQRESQKAIIIGNGGQMIKKLGTLARTEIEAFLGRKVFLELFVKVRPKWRDSELLLRAYGYQ